MKRTCSYYAILEHGDLLAIEKKRKHRLYGYISRTSGKAMTIVQGTIKIQHGLVGRGQAGNPTLKNEHDWSLVTL